MTTNPERTILVTGVAGSGKTTLRREFYDRGYETLDIDDGFAHWVDRQTGEPAKIITEDPPMILRHDWNLRVDELSAAIAKTTIRPIFVFGSAHDLYKHSGLFDRIILLSYPSWNALEQRIINRDTSDYGRAPGELEKIIEYWPVYEERFKNIGAKVIDCTLPIEEIINKISERSIV